MSNSYGTAEYGGYSGLGGSRMGIRGKQGLAPTTGSHTFYDNWLYTLVGDASSGWLYNDGNGDACFDKELLKQAFIKYWNSLMGTDGPMPDGYDSSWIGKSAEEAWNDFWAWFSVYGEDGSFDESGTNEYYRLPLPDGVGALIVLALLNILLIYLRDRDKQQEVKKIK